MFNEEIVFILQLMNNVLIDLCKENNLKSRESFLLTYYFSCEESRRLDHLFRKFVEVGGTIRLRDFQKAIKEEVGKDITLEIAKELVTVYKDYQPLFYSRIDKRDL